MITDIVLNKRVRVYDYPKYIDRYTIVLMDQYEGDGVYACIGCNSEPSNPQGIGQSSCCRCGRHLGKRVPFDTLPETVKTFVHQYLIDEVTA